MRKIKFLLSTLVLLLGAVTASAADVTVYIDPVGDGTWMADNAKISVNVYTDGQTNNTWVTTTTYSGNVLKVTFPDTYNRMIIVRGINQNEWGWNQTENITPVDNTLYKANGYNGAQMIYTTVNPYVYKVDFNTEISTSSHDFAVAPKWKHIVDSYDDNYVSYSYCANEGVNGTGCLLVYDQNKRINYSTRYLYDLLVTPKVSGTIRLKVKVCISADAESSKNAFVQLYSLNASATEKDELLKEFKTEIPGYNSGSGDWVELTYEVGDTPQRIGIRAQYVYMDNFIADAIDNSPEPALSVSAVMNSDGATGTQGTNPVFEQQPDGNMKVVLKVTLSNTGNVDFVAGTTENYTMTPAWKTNYSALTYYEDAAIDITEDIAAGESKTLDVEFTVPYTSGYKYWYIKENVTGTTSSSYRYATSAAYESKFVLRVAESGSTSDLTTAQDYGLVSSATTRSFEIYNNGTAPLTIKSITLPEGFTSDNLPEIPVDGLVLAKKEATAAFNVTLPVTTTGDFSGNLVIKYVKAGDTEETTKTLAFSGSVLAEGTWFADFNGDKSSSTGVYPEGSVVTSSTTLQFGSTGSYGSYDHYLKSYSSAGTLVMPKLTATAGAQLKYDAVKYQSGSSNYLKVYVSTDRKTWGEPVATINNSDLETSGQRYTQTLTFDEAGDYYIAFELKGVGLDNVIGLTKTAVAHDLYIKSVNWPNASINSGVAQTRPIVSVIPLTTETAGNYTVKYIYGENEVEIASQDLTASATSTTDFSASFTPNVATTTTFPGTKVVFDFGGGVTFETDPFTLTVVKEPKFHFVKTIPTSKSEPTDYTTPITFGKTNTADTQTFYVYNWGTAPLTVKSISVPEGFTVTPTEQFNVVAFDENNLSASSQAVTITFSTTTPGEYSGDMVITYVDGNGDDQTFELAVSGTKFDPTKWYANFDNPTENSCNWPAGSIYQSNVSGSPSTSSAPYLYTITSSSTTKNIFVTPKLAATAGEKLKFDAKLYSSYWSEGAVKVYAAATREEVLNTEEGTTRVQLFSVSGQDEVNPMTTDYQTFEVTVPEAGEYYFGFEISGRPYVDEINGLTPVAIAHDLMIASSNIPTDAMQNVATSASVNLLNLGLADEAEGSYEVNLYIGGEKAASAETTPALAMAHQLSAAGTQVTVPIYTLTTGTFPVYIEVKAGDYSVTTDPVDVTFAEEFAESNLTMSTGTASNANLLHLNWNNSETVSLYSATVLSNMGLKEGDKISSITYKGYNTGSKNYSTTLNVWYEFTDETTQSQPAAGKYDTSEMTNVLNTTRSWASVEGTSSNYVELITINFKTPIVYTAGKSLRMVVCSEGSQYQSGTYFVPSTVSGTSTSYYNRNDTQSYFENTQTWSANSYLPAIYIGLVAEPKTYSGTVKDDSGKAIENATVSLVSTDGKNVQYSAITDKNGAYSINVVQITREYDATATAYGYNDATDNNITFADNVAHDFELTPEASVSVTVTSAEWATITTPATYAVSFDENTEAYIATAEEGNSIKLTKIDDAPAMTPIVIHVTAGAGSYTMTQKATAASDVKANILKSAKGTEVGDGNGNYYVLGMNSSNVVGFGPLANGVTLAKGKAYLVPASPSGFLTFVIGDEDETTTINAVDAAGMDDDTPVYNLAGQKVGKDYKGVVIVNGRKVVRK